MGQDQPGGEPEEGSGPVWLWEGEEPRPRERLVSAALPVPPGGHFQEGQGLPVVLGALRAQWEGTWWGCTLCGDPAPAPSRITHLELAGSLPWTFWQMSRLSRPESVPS